MERVEHIRGETFHGRKGAVQNAFRYGVDYLLLDPDRARGPRLFSRNARNLVSLHDADYGGAPGQGRGTAWVREVLAAHGAPARTASCCSPSRASWGMCSTRCPSGCAMTTWATCGRSSPR